MIISHKYRYLFIEIPLTGSWAIRVELLQNYDGQLILHKHANYQEFKRFASGNELDYFKFATVRNPLDETVSSFFKLKGDHKGIYSEKDASIRTNIIDYADATIYQYIHNSELTFESFFLGPRIWDRPYSNMIDVSAPALDYVMRFEHLDEDFAEVLHNLGIEQVRPVPKTNKTRGRRSNWESYFTPPMITKAKKMYGPFMERWGYEFPYEWGPCRVSRFKEAEYKLSIQMKKLYLTHFRYSDSSYAKIVRKLHSTLKKSLY